jgi:hypothetical protein
MILEKKNPVGIDVEIYKIQKAINAAFDKKWSLKDDDGNDTKDGVICYPRCYVNFKKRNKDNIYAETKIEYFNTSDIDDSPTYIDTNNDYRDILDGEENRMFILTQYDTFPVNRTNNYESSMIEIFFIVNLNKTHPSIKHRADEEVRLDVKKVLQKIPNLTIHRMVKTLNRVFGDLRYSTTLDMHPMHCFKAVVSLDRFSDTTKICK